MTSKKIIDILQLTKEECGNKKYVSLGSPVMISEPVDKLNIYYFGSRMLRQFGKSLDDVVGYRILDPEEEPEFRKECGKFSLIVVKYYQKL